MDFTRKTYPHFHQAAIATALTLSVLSPAAWSEGCNEYPAVPLTVNITGESDDYCDDQISLREAISYASYLLTGKNTVTFASNLKGKMIEASNGRIDVRKSISIAGIDGAELITLKANNEAPLFYIESSADRIDFDLSHVILEKQAGSNHIIEMDGYGGDVNLDNIHTTDATRAYGIFTSQSKISESENNDLNLTLKNSSITGSTFDHSVLESLSFLNDDSGSDSNSNQTIKVLNSTISSSSGRALAATASGGKGSTSNSSASIIFESSIVENESDFNYLLVSESALGNAVIKIQDSKITDNSSHFLAVAYSYNESDIQIKKTTVTGNQVTSLFNSNASNPEGSANSIINIEESTISANTISYHGLRTSGDNNSINIQDSILCDNITDYGGDVPGDYSLISAYNANALDISNTNICNNQLQAIRLYASYRTDATAVINNSAINNNHSTASGAGIYASDGGKGTKLDLEITDSSISNNKSSQSGGGISIKTYDSFAIGVNINNSTISGNQTGTRTTDYGAGILVDGEINMDISNSTITNNTSTGFGGGVAMVEFDESTSLNIKNSIVADNTSAYGSGDLYGSFTITSSLIKDIPATSGTSINGTTMDQIGDEEGQTPDTGNNILGQDPLLQDLSLSGGTWVHQLSAGSPAIAAGNALAGNLPEFDQRGEGFARIRTGNGIAELDLGAVQYFANPVAVNDEVSVTTASENNLINVLNNDAQNSDGLALDAGSITIMTHPENGTAEAQQDGTILYTPNAGFVGEDTLIYMLQDIAGNNSTEATVTITVSENSADSGGPLQLWILSLLAAFGLRRKFN